jgi:hypothetical protein
VERQVLKRVQRVVVNENADRRLIGEQVARVGERLVDSLAEVLGGTSLRCPSVIERPLRGVKSGLRLHSRAVALPARGQLVG